MKVKFKGEDLGTFKGESLTVQEMRLVKQEMPEYKNPMKLLTAAGAIGTPVAVLGPDGKPTFVPVLDDDGNPVLDADGNPTTEAAIEIVPSDDWDPDAFAMFVCILMRRQGRDANIEDIDGTLQDLEVEPDAEERAEAKKQAARMGKAPATPTTPAAGPRKK